MSNPAVRLFPLDQLEWERTFGDLPSVIRDLDPLTQAIKDSSTEAVALAMVLIDSKERSERS